MKKLFLIVLVVLILTGCSKQQISKVCIDQNCFNVEIADSRAEQATGLMHREHLNENNGMLFVFENEDYRNFWMKNTLISLDMIWIDENKTVVSIFSNAQPCKTENCESIRPLKKSMYVLEINGGVAAKKSIEVGDRVEFQY